MSVAWLVLASLFFYGWWNPQYLVLIIGSILFNFAMGSLMSRFEPGSRKDLLAVAVLGNVGLLGYFKYANFFVEVTNQTLGTGFHLETIVLPLAISFFTLQQIAYVVDAAYTPENADAIVSLARNADILFIEAHFLQEDAERATARNHLTAHQAGALAACSNVKVLHTFHYSPRYRGREMEIVQEADAAFRGSRRAEECD